MEKNDEIQWLIIVYGDGILRLLKMLLLISVEELLFQIKRLKFFGLGKCVKMKLSQLKETISCSRKYLNQVLPPSATPLLFTVV